jgi:hypothetical protein
MSQPLMAYKGFVYRVETEELLITKRYMTLHGSDEQIDLSEWGEITLNEFRQIVDSHLNAELQ